MLGHKLIQALEEVHPAIAPCHGRQSAFELGARLGDIRDDRGDVVEFFDLECVSFVLRHLEALEYCIWMVEGEEWDGIDDLRLIGEDSGWTNGNYPFEVR